MNRFARAIVGWGSWLILGVIVVDALLVYSSLATINQSNRLVDHSREILNQLEATLSVLKDAETGQRGYLLTDRENYLEPYLAAESGLEAEIKQLRLLTSEDSRQQASVKNFETLAAQKMAELRETIALHRDRKLQQALDIVQSDRGKDLMGQARSVADDVQNEEGRLLTIHIERSQAAVVWTIITFTLTTGLSVLLVAGVLALQRRDLRERERAAEAIRMGKAWLATTLTSIGDALIATDERGRVRFLNPVAESLTGWPQAEAEGKSIEEVFNIVNEYTREPTEHPVLRVIREGIIVGLANHTTLIAKGGSETPIEDSAAPIRDGQGAISGVVMVFRDVTEARRAETALRESEARKTAILEASLDAIITIDQEGKIVDFNPAAASTFGFDRKDFLGRFLGRSINTESLRAVHLKGLDHYLKTGEGPILGKRIEVTAIRSDETEFPIELAITKIATGGSPLFTAYLRDISARKQAENELVRLLGELEAERRHLEAVIQSSQDCIKELDLQGLVIMVSEAGQRLMGIYEHCEFVNKPWLDFWEGADREMAREALDKALAGGVGAFEGYSPTLIGEPKWWDVRVTPIMSAQGEPERLLSVSRDITERRRHADERERLLTEAQEASRAKSQFLAILSHELRTPLNPILLAVTSMIDRPMPPEEVGPTLEMIRHNVNLQARLIDDLLDVMRIVQGKMPLHWGVADCHEVIKHAVLICQSEVFGKVIRLSLDLAAKDHYVNADSARLQQVFWNLIKNAVKFSPEGGTITIRSRQEPENGSEEPGERLLIEISDTGIGIEPEALPRIFDPFQQGETSITRRFGGLGLGLAICKGVIDAHGGTITVESDGKGRGTTFKITLKSLPTPAVDANGRTHDLAPSSSETPQNAPTMKILVVEDEVATRRLMARLLRSLGHEVTTAGTIAEGLEATEGGTFDLIVSDIGLPDGSGLDLMRKVVARGGKMPSIALTGYGMEEDIVRSREAGFTTHMTKPIDFTKLEAMIRQVAH